MCGPARGGRLRPLLRLARPSCTELEMPNFIDRNFDSPLDLAAPAAARRCELVAARRASAARRARSRRYFDDERLRRLFSFQAMYAGLAPVRGARRLRGDHLHGHRRRRVRPRGRHARAAGRRWPTAAEKAGVDVRATARRVERIVLRRGHDGPVAGRRASTGGELLDGRRGVCNADLPGGLPHAAARPRRRRAAARRGRYSPSALVWHVGRARRACRRARPTTTSTSAASGTASFRRPARRRRRGCPTRRSSSPCRRSTSRRWRRRAATSLYVLEPVPNLDGRVDWTRRAAAGPRRPAPAASTRLGYPTDVEVEQLVDPTRLGGRRAWSGARRSRCRTRFFQTGPFRPSNLDRRAPGLVFAGSGTVPGVGVPMVLVSGELAAERVQRRAGRGDGPRAATDHARQSSLRRTAARSTERHGTTYYWSTFAAAAGRSATTCTPLYGVLPLRRRHRRRPRRRHPSRPRATRSRDFGDRFFADLDAGRSDDPVLKAVVHTVRALRHRPATASAASCGRWRWT